MISSSCLTDSGLKFTEYLNIKDPSIIFNYDEIGQFLDGFSYYDNFLTRINPDKFNNNILKEGQLWETYRDGLIPNFSNVEGSV